jgi:hypothetical protein
MSTDRPKRETMSIEEATDSNMWEIVAMLTASEKEGSRNGYQGTLGTHVPHVRPGPT